MARLDLEQFEGHTPGPWILNADNFLVNSGANTPTICEVFVRNGAHVKKEDAKLIAAAPDLLAEVKMLREQLGLAVGEIAYMHAENSFFGTSEQVKKYTQIILDRIKMIGETQNG